MSSMVMMRSATRISSRQKWRSLSSAIPIHAKKPTSSSSSSSSSEQSQYRKQVSFAKLLQRYGFPSSQLHNFLSKNRSLLDSDLADVEKSLGILLFTFKIPQKDLTSLVLECPGVLDHRFLRDWESGFVRSGLPSGSPLMIKSLLEHSRRSQLGSDCFSRSVEVLRELGFSESTLVRVLEGFPGVNSMNRSEIRKRIEFLMEIPIPIPMEGVVRVLRSVPQVLGFGVEDRLAPLMSELKGWGFSEDLIRKEILREPRIIGMEVGELSRCLELLRSLKCREPIKEKILSEGELRAGFEVKLRVDFFCGLGLTRREAFEVLWKEPRAIIYRLEDIEKKVNFMVNRMRFGIRSLLDVPEFMGVNFDKQIVSRFNVIEYLRSKDGLGCEIRLRDMIKPSRLKFYNLYVKPYPECEKMFPRYSRDAEVKSRHPVGLWKSFKPEKYPDSQEHVENMRSFMELSV